VRHVFTGIHGVRRAIQLREQLEQAIRTRFIPKSLPGGGAARIARQALVQPQLAGFLLVEAGDVGFHLAHAHADTKPAMSDESGIKTPLAALRFCVGAWLMRDLRPFAL
jgi:hypothetical protein